MKQWWAKYKERAAERQKIANANIERSFEAFDRMMFEERERVEVKRLEKLAAKNESMPPRFAIYLAYLFLPKRYREIVLGDMIEQYPALRARLGRFRACARIYKQVFFSTLPLVKESIRRDVDRFFIQWDLAKSLISLISRLALVIFMIYEMSRYFAFLFQKMK